MASCFIIQSQNNNWHLAQVAWSSGTLLLYFWRTPLTRATEVKRYYHYTTEQIRASGLDQGELGRASIWTSNYPMNSLVDYPLSWCYDKLKNLITFYYSDSEGLSYWSSPSKHLSFPTWAVKSLSSNRMSVASTLSNTCSIISKNVDYEVRVPKICTARQGCASPFLHANSVLYTWQGWGFLVHASFSHKWINIQCLF